MHQDVKKFRDFKMEDLPEENQRNEYFGSLVKEVSEGENYREVLYTGENLQLVKMNIQPNQEIGSEVHEEGDQFFYIISGEGVLELEEESFEFKTGDGMTITQGKRHNVINTSDKEPEHPEGTIHKTKKDE
jgi:mannose-6-phosphate isomerase-like protein (cupin superfamily)